MCKHTIIIKNHVQAQWHYEQPYASTPLSKKTCAITLSLTAMMHKHTIVNNRVQIHCHLKQQQLYKTLSNNNNHEQAHWHYQQSCANILSLKQLLYKHTVINNHVLTSTLS